MDEHRRVAIAEHPRPGMGEASVVRRTAYPSTNTAARCVLGEEDIEPVSAAIQRRRVRTRLCWHRLEPPHGTHVDDIDHPRIPHGDVQAAEGRVEKDHGPRAGERDLPEHATGRCSSATSCPASHAQSSRPLSTSSSSPCGPAAGTS